MIRTLVAIMSVVALSGTPVLSQTPEVERSPQYPPSPAEPPETRPHEKAEPPTGALAEHEFIQKAATGGKAEVELAKIAAEKAQHPEVRQFAEQMIQDHTRANENLKKVAQKEGAQVPQELDPEHKQTLERLQKLSGEEFDRAYMEQQVKEHEKTVQMFEQQVKGGKDPEVKAFARDALPTLKHHLNEAKEVNRQVEQRVSQRRG